MGSKESSAASMSKPKTTGLKQPALCNETSTGSAGVAVGLPSSLGMSGPLFSNGGTATGH